MHYIKISTFTHCIHINCLQIWHWISYCVLVLLGIILVNGLLMQYRAQNNHLKVLNRMQIIKKILVDERFPMILLQTPNLYSVNRS